MSEELKDVKQTLEELKALVKKSLLEKKEVLSIDEAAEYTGLAKSYIYKLTSSDQIPYYKPIGKRIYFDVDELNDFLRRNKVEGYLEAERRADMLHNG